MPEPKEQNPRPYAMPAVYVGETVYWSFEPGKEKLLGLVTSKSDTTVNLLQTADGSERHKTVRGARHVSDPALKNMVANPGGVWQHTEFGEKLHKLID